ncbi:MAG: hypothetical protein WCK08_20510, partial [Betaproteobacteria bacterium]
MAIFPGDATQPQDWARIEAVRQDWLQGADGVHLTLVSSEQLGGAMAAFTAQGPSGGPEVFVNRQWLSGLGTDADLLRVLVEELGHSLDASLNGASDSPGDEGELFAAHVLALPLEPAQRQRIALEDDHALLWWGLSSYAVEQANFSANANISDGRLSDASNTITGNVSLTSTDTINGGRMLVGTGSSTYGDPRSYLNGDSTTGSDTLTIRATGVVRFYAAVGLTDPLEGLSITSPAAAPTNYPSGVIFEQDVVLDGPLVIETDGVVTFTGSLTINNGGLTIRGASEIYFNNPVTVNGGDVLLEGNEIDFRGNASLKATGRVLTLRTTTVGLGMEVGSPSQIDLAKLDISLADLAAMAGGGFSKVVLGHVDGSGHAVANQGQLRFAGAQSTNQYSIHAPLEAYAGSIRIEDIENESDPALAIKGSVLLDATGDIEIRNRLVASTDLGQASALKNITLYSSSGKVIQVDETRLGFSDGLSNEPLQGADLFVQAATGIDLIATEVETASLYNTGATGNIRLVETAAGGALALSKALIGNASNTGVVSVQTLASSGGNLTVSPAAAGDVSSPGSLSLRAGETLTLGANADLVRSGGLALGGTIDLEAGAAVVMTGRTLKAAGDIHVQAGTSLAVGLMEGAANVALLAGGAITDGDADVDITAVGLLLQAGAAGGVGGASDALETTVSTLTGAAGSSGMFVLESNALTVGAVSVTVNRLSSTGSSGTKTSSQSDLPTTAGNGAIVLRTSAGSITLSDGDTDGVAISANGSGNIFIQALGAATDITASADIS